MTASLHKQCYSIHCTHSFTFQKRATPVCVNFTCSTGPVLSITRILNIEPALSFAGAFTFCRTKLKVNMNQVHSVRNVCEKCQGNAANHSRVESCTKLEVTDGRTDGQLDRQTDRQISQFQYTPLHYVGGGIINQGVDIKYSSGGKGE